MVLSWSNITHLIPYASYFIHQVSPKNNLDRLCCSLQRHALYLLTNSSLANNVYLQSQNVYTASEVIKTTNDRSNIIGLIYYLNWVNKITRIYTQYDFFFIILKIHFFFAKIQGVHIQGIKPGKAKPRMTKEKKGSQTVRCAQSVIIQHRKPMSIAYVPISKNGPLVYDQHCVLIFNQMYIYFLSSSFIRENQGWLVIPFNILNTVKDQATPISAYSLYHSNFLDFIGGCIVK